jgi:hypothetical protein
MPRGDSFTPTEKQILKAGPIRDMHDKYEMSHHEVEGRAWATAHTVPQRDIQHAFGRRTPTTTTVVRAAGRIARAVRSHRHPVPTALRVH